MVEAQRSLTLDSTWSPATTAPDMGVTGAVFVSPNPVGTNLNPKTFLQWYIYNKQFYNLDTGYTFLVIRHEIVTPIYADDVITFELRFQNANAAGSNTMKADAVRCTSQINTKDSRFWTQSVTDGYYYSTDAGTTFIYAADTTNDWLVYHEDDDPDSKFCEWDPATYGYWFPSEGNLEAYQTPFQCTKMYCYAVRRLDSTDTV